MTLIGFLAFFDPPKETARAAIGELMRHGVAVRVLTGDNAIVTKSICARVGIDTKHVLTGEQIHAMNERELREKARHTTIFAHLEPADKERIVRALKHGDHVVGYMGDGINDALALKSADVGISVDTAVDIAKESSDIILLEQSLMVLKDGVREGRRIFANIVKYIRMSASSNFGNMFSVVGGSIFLPFLPMLPIQVIANNMLYDISQVTIPNDHVDEEYVTKPRRWNIQSIARFIKIFGPISSIFDFATFALLLTVFSAGTNPALFHTGWFIESLFTQMLVIHAIRTSKIPFVESRASWPLVLSTTGVLAVAVYLPMSPIAQSLGFVPLPVAFWPWLIGLIFTYLILTQIVKTWFIKRHGWE